MKVVFNGVICELDKELTTEQERFINEMERNNFVFTYYAPKDIKGNSIESIVIKLKNKILK